MERVYRLGDIERNLQAVGFYPLDVLVVGGTGAGKSSTLNVLFGQEVARVGRGCDPETAQIAAHSLHEKMRFWDTPGLGDGVEKDRRYAKELVQLLYRDYHMDGQQYGLIDTVLVILDGTGRDMGTTYRLLNEVIVPHFQRDRILVAVNQADMAMKGRHWDELRNQPDKVLEHFLKEKAESVQERVWEATGVRIRRPVCYSAERGYHVAELLDMIIDNMPKERRMLDAF